MLTVSLWAEVNVISVTDEDKHSTKRDFQHTFEFFASSKDGFHKCQATRIHPRWFTTAAHCVKEVCQEQCSIRIDLLETSVSALAEGVHTAKDPIVFIHPEYGKKLVVNKDIALIKLDLRRASKIYYRRAADANQANIAMPKRDFLAWLRRNPSAKQEYQRIFNSETPPIVEFDIDRNVRIDRQLSVISIFDGKRSIKKAITPVYYLKELGYAYTTNFGIRKGMSGSGVMSNTGELVGIISATIEANLQQGKQTISHEKWFTFPVFTASIIEFMRDTMGSDFYQLDRKDAYPAFVINTHKDLSKVTQVLKNTKYK